MKTLYQRYKELAARAGFESMYAGTEERSAGYGVLSTVFPRMRIFAEIDYGIRLSENLNGKYDDLLDKAIAVLAAGMRENYVPEEIWMEAENILMPMAEDAKAYKMILAGHAHIDMNWQWSWSETVATTIATFTTMLNLMEEYPEYTFCQSQTSVYKIIDDYAPHLKPRIQQRIREGRWEVNAAAWVENDKNMPSTESLLRHIQYTRKYLHENWDIPEEYLNVDFSPDTFGHSANLPEIDSYGDVKYYYHCRGVENGHPNLYRWRGQSGKEILVCREHAWYNGHITPEKAMNLIGVCNGYPGLKTALVVYGVGDHGGGPTRRDVERAVEMQKWPIFPTIKFGTLREFFREAEAIRDTLPVIEGEMNFIFDGCYTSQSEIKRGNRRCEIALSEAETVSAFAHIRAGAAIREDALEKAWQKVLLTHFHDILTGSCTKESREYALGQYQEVMAVAQSETDLALTQLSEQIDTSGISVTDDRYNVSQGAGVGYSIDTYGGHNVTERGQGMTRIWNVFNTSTADKSETVEITVWDWPGNIGRVKVTDSAGNPLPFRVDGSWNGFWDHWYFRILVQLDIPAMSYKTVVLDTGDREEHPSASLLGAEIQGTEDFIYTLENKHILCRMDVRTGHVVSITDKATGKEQLSAPACLTLVDLAKIDMSAWKIGKFMKETPVCDVQSIQAQHCAVIRPSIAFTLQIRGTRINLTYSLDKNDRMIRADIQADWRELPAAYRPHLTFRVPLAYGTEEFAYDIPAGVAVRKAANADRPGQSYVRAVSGEDYNMAIVSDCKYGFRAIQENGKAVLYASLIHASDSPDRIPEFGPRSMKLGIGLLAADPAEAEETAISFARSMPYVSTNSHKGTLPADGTLCRVDCKGGVTSAVFAKDGALFVRVFSVSDQAEALTVDAGLAVKAAELVDLYGAKTGDCAVEDGRASAVLPPHAIVTVKMCF